MLLMSVAPAACGGHEGLAPLHARLRRHTHPVVRTNTQLHQQGSMALAIAATSQQMRGILSVENFIIICFECNDVRIRRRVNDHLDQTPCQQSHTGVVFLAE